MRHASENLSRVTDTHSTTMFKSSKASADRRRDAGTAPVDAARFKDDVALKTDWGAINTYAANFDTRVLKTADAHRLSYRTTLGTKLFGGLFMGVGIGFLSFMGLRQHGRWLPASFVDEGLAQLVCLFFFVMGAAGLYFVSTPITFDNREKTFVKGRRRKRRTIRFSAIHAFQLIPVRVASTDGPDYWNYQLNVVLADGERAHVVSYSNATRARKDAAVLADFVGTKVWDAS